MLLFVPSYICPADVKNNVLSQPSDSFAFDGGSGSDIGVGGNDDKLDLLFAPAAPAVVKKTKGNKVVLGKDRNPTSTTDDGYGHPHMSTPGSHRSSRKKQFDIISNITGSDQQRYQQQRQHYQSGSPSYSAASPSSTRSTPTKSPPQSVPMAAPGTPPLPNNKRRNNTSSLYYLEGDNDEDDPFYKEWWMACFADALQGAKNLSDTTLQGARNLSETMFKKD